jgi:hypothetical protein
MAGDIWGQVEQGQRAGDFAAGAPLRNAQRQQEIDALNAQRDYATQVRDNTPSASPDTSTASPTTGSDTGGYGDNTQAAAAPDGTAPVAPVTRTDLPPPDSLPAGHDNSLPKPDKAAQVDRKGSVDDVIDGLIKGNLPDDPRATSPTPGTSALPVSAPPATPPNMRSGNALAATPTPPVTAQPGRSAGPGTPAGPGFAFNQPGAPYTTDQVVSDLPGSAQGVPPGLARAHRYNPPPPPPPPAQTPTNTPPPPITDDTLGGGVGPNGRVSGPDQRASNDQPSLGARMLG